MEIWACRSPSNCEGEVLEPLLQGAGQDRSFVLDGERVSEVDETLDVVANLLSLAGQEVTYAGVSVDGCDSDNQAVTRMDDAQFSRRRGRHILVRDISLPCGCDWGQAGGVLLYGECFKRVGCSRTWADNISANTVSDNLLARCAVATRWTGPWSVKANKRGPSGFPCVGTYNALRCPVVRIRRLCVPAKDAIG
jgi:hypothetical protein